MKEKNKCTKQIKTSLKYAMIKVKYHLVQLFFCHFNTNQYSQILC